MKQILNLFFLLLFTLLSVSINIAKADTATGETFRLNKVASPSTVAPGGTVTYAVTITNVSTTNAAPQTIIDTLPTGFTYSGNGTLTTISGSQVPFAPTVTQNILSWSFDGETLQSIPPNQNIVVSYAVTASSETGVFTNQACLTAPENVCVTTPVTVANNPNTGIVEDIAMTTLLGGIAIYAGLYLRKQRSFEERIISSVQKL
jgi:uncharacterized repeat protein (TIGR01451 family)